MAQSVPFRVLVALALALGLLLPAAAQAAVPPAQQVPFAPVSSPVLPASAPGVHLPVDSATCGGLAPLDDSCSTSIVLQFRPLDFGQTAFIGFVGELTASLSSSTASYSISCDWYAVIGLCGPYRGSGIFFVGQRATLSGSTSFVASGFWEVWVTND